MRSPCCPYICVFHPNAIVRQRFSKHVPAATNTHGKLKFLDAVIYVRFVSHIILST
jgi:hypothetical protein